MLIPRRVCTPLVGWIMHGRTSAQLSRCLSRIAGVTPLIVPFDVADKTQQILDRR